MNRGVVHYFQAERSHKSPHSPTCYSSHGGISQDATSLTWITGWLKLGKSLFWQIWTNIFFCLCVCAEQLKYWSTGNVWSSAGRSLGWKALVSKWRGRWGPWWYSVLNVLPAMQEIWVWSLGWEDPWRRNGNPLQYSCLGNPMDHEAWWAIAHGVAKSWTQPGD